MMSIGKMSVTIADNYHQKDGYHASENRGIYYGRLADEHDLGDQPIGDEWHNLVRGRSPDGRETHIDHQRREEDAQRAGTDLVFNGSKSTSVLIEIFGDTENQKLADLIRAIEETREESIYETLDMVQENYLAARVSENGQQRLEYTASALFGIFQHHVSRDGDPHTHTHCFLLNQTRRRDGSIRATENNPILRDQRWIGQYQTSLWASRLEERGVALLYNKDGSFEIAGVSRELMDRFSKSKERIDKAVETLRDKYPQASEAQLREWANLETRPYKNRDLSVPDQRREVWRPEALGMGWTDEKIIEAQKEGQRSRERHTQERVSPIELLRLAADVATRNESIVSRAEVLTTAGKLGSGMHPQLLVQAFDQAVRSGNLMYKEHAGGYTTQEIIARVSDIVKQISLGRGTHEPVMEREAARSAIEAYRTKDGHELTSDQKGALEMLLASRDQFAALYGLAGTGKSSLFDAFRRLCGSRKVMGLSFTGRAASELGSAAGIETKTIDSFICSGEKMQRGMIYIVDETSFVGDRQMHQLVSQAREAGARLIFSGDPAQFKAISAGNPFKLLEGKLDQYVIREIVRQSDKADREISSLFGEGKAAEAVDMLINKGSVIEVKDRDELLSCMVKDYFDRGSGRTALMTPWNRTRSELNDRIHAEAVRRGEIGEDSRTVAIRQPVSMSPAEQRFANAYKAGQFAFFRTGSARGREGRIIEVDQQSQTITLEPTQGGRITIDVRQEGERLSVYEERQIELNSGEKVVFLKNDRRRHWKVDNGQAGTFLHVREDGRAVFEIKGKERVAPENYNYFDRGWCITDVKAQGLSEQQAMGDSPDTTSSLYVMATRHKDSQGFRLYTTDLEEVRAAARNLDEKHAAISEPEAARIAREYDGRKGQERELVTEATEGASDLQGRQISRDDIQVEGQALPSISGQKEGCEAITAPVGKIDREHERELER